MDKLDSVYFLVQRLPDKKLSVMYSAPATNAHECWVNACVWDSVMGGGSGPINSIYLAKWKKSMVSSGWRAEKLNICKGELT